MPAKPSERQRLSELAFIEAWSRLGSMWGGDLNLSMARVHALLMLRGTAMDMEEVMTYFGMSRGNASMTLQKLRTWGLVTELKSPGERRMTYKSVGTCWDAFDKLSTQRREFGLQPVLELLGESDLALAKEAIEIVEAVSQALGKAIRGK